MTSPTFDRDGYPTEETLLAIEQWNHRDPQGWFKFCKDSLHPVYSTFSLTPEGLEITTGGWSGNEDVIGAMQKNILWTVYWINSHRGGRFLLDYGGPI